MLLGQFRWVFFLDMFLCTLKTYLIYGISQEFFICLEEKSIFSSLCLTRYIDKSKDVLLSKSNFINAIKFVS